MEPERVPEHGPAAARASRPQAGDDRVHLRKLGDGHRGRDELPRDKGRGHGAEPCGDAAIQPQTELRMPLGMDMPQVGLDHHVAEAGAADPVSVRILSLARSTEIMGKGWAATRAAWAQELDLDSHPPQEPSAATRGWRAEGFSDYGNVVHHVPRHGHGSGRTTTTGPFTRLAGGWRRV